jgi:hypothetical protein
MPGGYCFPVFMAKDLEIVYIWRLTSLLNTSLTGTALL